ncbi:MAG: hypothetical protein OSJ59_01690 [Lachnospiraceae bacterium]|nr:hypothetical protein [Lachnospiraceae bacterium]
MKIQRWIKRSALLLCIGLLLGCAIPLAVQAEEEAKIEGGGEEWEEVLINGRGIKVVNGDGAEIVIIDKYGGIYLNGTIYVNQNEYQNISTIESDTSSFNFIVIYIMLIVLFILYFVILCGRDKGTGGNTV